MISSFGLFQLLGNNSQAFEYSGVSVNSFVHGGIDEDGDIRLSVNNSDNDSIATKNNNIKNNGDVDGNTIANNVVTNEYIDENSARVCEKNPDFGHLIVDIGGAVQTPGVYELDAGSRVNDLINLAGGFSDTVDKYYINKVLNLSERLVDGKKFYIPTLAESIELQKVTHKKDSFQDEVNNIVSINFSSKELLTSLAGIGDKRANDIVANRPYNSIQELVENKIITQFIFDTIKNDISL